MISPKNKDVAIIAAAIIYTRKVDNLVRANLLAPASDLARDAAAEVAVLIYAVEKHLTPGDRRPKP